MPLRGMALNWRGKHGESRISKIDGCKTGGILMSKFPLNPTVFCRTDDPAYPRPRPLADAATTCTGKPRLCRGYCHPLKPLRPTDTHAQKRRW